MNHRPLLPVVVLFVGCASAPPPPPKPSAAAPAIRFEAGPGPYSFNCNEPAGKYTTRNAHVPDAMFTVNGTIQFVGLQTDAKWAPFAAVDLPGAKENSFIGFTASVDPYQPGKIQVGIRNTLSWRGGKAPAIFATMPFTNEAIPFSMALDKPESLLVAVGDFKRTVSFPKQSFSRVRMTCSTAHVRFSNVAVTVNQ
jgi:hypothetical protein